jgi:hypothetical protein
MNYQISVLFRAIPILMGALSAGMGAFVLTHASGPDAYVAGRVLVFLAAICVCLFATAATIIRQLIHRYTTFDRVLYPALAFAATGTTIGYGVSTLETARPEDFVAGHVVAGIGLICGCVFTVATVSTQFSLIPTNSSSPEGSQPLSPPPFPRPAARVLLAVPVVLALAAWIWAITLLAGVGGSTATARFTAGHVMVGLAAVCTCLIGLVASILRQVANTYIRGERLLWPPLAFSMGLLSLVWGLVLVVVQRNGGWITPGFVLIGLGLICWSILTKELLLALVWRRVAPLANRVPLIPVGTALACLFLAAFLFEWADPNALIAARVLTGFGAVCFSLFSIVSILESGTSD